MREVAAEAGISTGSLTHYFADKREILIATLRASLRQRRRRHRWNEQSDPIEMLLATLEGAMVLDDDARLHWLVTTSFCAHATGDPRLADEQRDAYREFRTSVVECVRRAQRDGAIDDRHDPEFAAEHLIAIADGIAVQCLFDAESWPPERQREHLRSAMSAYVSAA